MSARTRIVGAFVRAALWASRIAGPRVERVGPAPTTLRIETDVQTALDGPALAAVLRERRERLWERVRIAEGVPARASWLARMRTLTRERDEARAIVAGRTVAPTDAELEAHAAAGGGWRVRAQWSRAGTRQSIDTVRPWATGVARLLREQGDTRWWATDADGVLCAWPAVATEERAAR